MSGSWTCPDCGRTFARSRQRHACGTGDRALVLRNRAPWLVNLYGELEQFMKTLGPVEFVTRERYVLFRSRRIFADLNVLTDGLRLAIHLPVAVKHQLFFKVAADRRQHTHVAMLARAADLEALKPFLRKAYDFSLE